MLEEGRISALQALGFLTSTVLATAILFIPSISTAAAGCDAWLSLLPAGVFGAVAGLMAACLALRFQEETVIQFTPRLLGFIPGKIVGFIYILYFFFIVHVVLAEFHILLSTVYLPRTPDVVHIGVLLILVIYLVTKGLEVYCRVNGIILPILIVAVLIIFFSTVKDVRLENFQPMLENGLQPVIWGAFVPASWFSQIAIILMLTPYIATAERLKARRVILLAVLILVGVLTLILLAAIGHLSANRTATLLFPTFNLVRSINFETMPIFERQDPLFMVIWIAGMLVKVAAFFYVGLLALGQWLNLSTFRPLAAPMAILMVALTLQGFPNSIYLARYSTEIGSLVLLTINGGLTGLVYLAAVLKGSKHGTAVLSSDNQGGDRNAGTD